MIRTAISPRFAMRTRRNGASSAPSLRKDEAGSERDVAMLLPRIRVALVGEDLEGTDQAGTSLRWFDHFVDVATRRGDVWIRELRFVGPDKTCLLHSRIIRGGDRVLEDDVDRTLRAHHGDLGRRPREVHVAANVLAAHDVVRTAVRLARDD